MPKLKFVGNYKQSDLDALIMDQAEKEELDAILQRMNSLFLDFYKASVHAGNFQNDDNTKQEQGVAASMHAAQGGTHDHKD